MAPKNKNKYTPGENETKELTAGEYIELNISDEMDDPYKSVNGENDAQ